MKTALYPIHSWNRGIEGTITSMHYLLCVCTFQMCCEREHIHAREFPYHSTSNSHYRVCCLHFNLHSPTQSIQNVGLSAIPCYPHPKCTSRHPCTDCVQCGLCLPYGGVQVMWSYYSDQWSGQGLCNVRANTGDMPSGGQLHHSDSLQ